MRDGVMRPETQRFEFGGRAGLVLGAGVIAGFLPFSSTIFFYHFHQ